MPVPTMASNSPVAGSISWDAFTLQYAGVPHSIAAGSTSMRWVWWRLNGGNSVIEAGMDIPSTLTDDDIVLFGNKNGIYLRVQAAQLLDGELIVDGSVFADSIAANQISSTHVSTVGLDAGLIKFGTMSGDRILVNSLSGSVIKANSIAASSLLITDVENFIENGMGLIGTVGQLATGWGPSASGGPKIAVTTLPDGSSGRVLEMYGTGVINDSNNRIMDCAPGDEFWATGWVRRISGADTVGVIQVLGCTISLTDGTLAYASPPNLDVSTMALNTWYFYTGSVIMPPKAYQVKWRTSIRESIADGTFHLWNLQARRKANGNLIVDGAIDTNKISTVGLNANVIKFGTMQGDRIAANTISTDKLTVANLGDNIIVNGNFKELVGTVPNHWVAQTTGGTLGTAAVGSDVYMTVATPAAVSGSVYQNTIMGKIPANSNEQFYIEVGASSVGAAGTYSMVMYMYDRNDVLLGAPQSAVFASSNSATQLPLRNGAVMTVTSDPTVSYVRFGLVPKTSSLVYTFDEYVVSKVIVSAKIGNGQIDASKIVTAGLDAQVIKFGTMSGDRIAVNTINSNHVVTAGLDAAVIKFGTMSGDRITANTINTGHIITAGLDAAVVKFGTMSGDRIAANTISASKIIAASITARELSFVALTPDGMAKNPDFSDWTGTLPNFYGQFGTVVPTKSTTVIKSGLSSAKFVALSTDNAGFSNQNAWNQLSSNEPYITLTANVRLDAGGFGGSGFLVDFGAGTGPARQIIRLTEQVPSAQIGKWYRITEIIPRPAGYVADQPLSGYFMANWPSMGFPADKTIYIDFMDIRPSTQAEIDSYLAGTWRSPGTTTIRGDMISTGSIDSTRIVTAGLDAAVIKFGTMSGDRITANTISTNHIVTAGLDAATIKFGTMQGDRIAVGTLNADRINFTTMAGKSITGAIIKTSETGQRIVLQSDQGYGVVQLHTASPYADPAEPGGLYSDDFLFGTGPTLQATQFINIESPRFIGDAAQHSAFIQLTTRMVGAGSATYQSFMLLEADSISFQPDGASGQLFIAHDTQVTGSFLAPAAAIALTRVTTAISVPTATWTGFTSNNGVYNKGGVFTTPSGNIAVSQSGVYNFTGQVEWPTNATGRRLLMLEVVRSGTSPALGGGEIFSRVEQTGTSTGPICHQVTGDVELFGGDVVRMVGYQTSGATLATTVGGHRLSGHLVGT